MADVLVVDDDPTIRTLIRCALEQYGHIVREAEDGNAGLQEFLSAPADLVVADIGMPQLNGLEMIAKLRRWGTSAPILAISGGVSGGASDLLFSSVMQGASGFLPKPFTAQELVRLVSELLALHSSDFQLWPSAKAEQPEQQHTESGG